MVNGLYNVLFGENRLAPVLKAMLELDEFGEWKTGRYRDIFLDEGGKVILLYTRNGGGNRECDTFTAPEDIEKCQGCDWWDKDTCPARACVVLKKHPCYIEDWDDDFDPTYAYFKFKVPEKYRELAEKLFKWQGTPKTISQKFDEITKEIKSKSREELEKDPRFKPLIEALKRILEE